MVWKPFFAKKQRVPVGTHVSHQASSTALLLPSVEEDELLEIDGLLAGSAAAGPAAQDGL
jgi:hypothetical protein